MTDQTILIIRHAEKPANGSAFGVDAVGNPDAKSLTPLGWQRAGAWTALFAPALGQPAALPRPTAIFASALARREELEKGVGGRSRRPLETVMGLAAHLGLAIDQSVTKGQERDLAAALARIEGVALVCWQHETIAAIVRALAPQAPAPETWPGDRFNVVFHLARKDRTAAWRFSQLAPIMLAGDKPDLL
jgi:hypothetical protein